MAKFKVHTLRCPSCGASVNFEDDSSKCQNCDSTLVLELDGEIYMPRSVYTVKKKPGVMSVPLILQILEIIEKANLEHDGVRMLCIKPEHDKVGYAIACEDGDFSYTYFINAADQVFDVCKLDVFEDYEIDDDKSSFFKTVYKTILRATTDSVLQVRTYKVTVGSSAMYLGDRAVIYVLDRDFAGLAEKVAALIGSELGYTPEVELALA